MIIELIITAIVLFIVWAIIYDYKKKSERHLDDRGYERNGYADLVHRRIAYNNLYDYPNTHQERFGEYDIHHIDKDKRNNSPNNLKILTRAEHRKEHGHTRTY